MLSMLVIVKKNPVNKQLKKGILVFGESLLAYEFNVYEGCLISVLGLRPG